ncbi:MAG: hypothetical protein WCA08_13340 [Desulfoferrobacter sp.]
MRPRTEDRKLINDPDVINISSATSGCGSSTRDPHEGKTKTPADGPVVFDDFDDGWPRYEEPVFVYH